MNVESRLRLFLKGHMSPEVERYLLGLNNHAYNLWLDLFLKHGETEALQMFLGQVKVYNELYNSRLCGS